MVSMCRHAREYCLEAGHTFCDQLQAVRGIELGEVAYTRDTFLFSNVMNPLVV